MKPQKKNSRSSTPRMSKHLALLMAGLAPTAYSAEIIKANNADALSGSSSWVGGMVPGAQDIAVFNSTVAANTAMDVNESLSWLGIKVVGNTDGLIFDSFFPSGLGTAAILTLGSSGLDLSAATSGTTFSFDSPTMALPAGRNQTWSVADGARLRVRGPLSRGAGASLNYSLGATNTGVVVVDDASFGAVGVINHFSTVNGNDFAGVQTIASLRTVVPGASLGLYQANPAPDAATVSPTPANTNGNLMDFTATTTSDGSLPLNGITVPNGWFFQGFRFNVPNARTDVNEWTINTSNRTITPSIGIVVGPGVGTDNVVFTGTGWFRVGKGTNQIQLAQNNPQGDLIFSNGGGLNAETAAAASVIKSGVGRVIMNSAITANAGLYINAGTMQFGSGGTVGSPGTGVIVNNGALVFNRSDALVVGSIISGTGPLTKSGAGALTLSGANTYTGATSINGGSIVLGNAAALGVTSSLALTGGGLNYGAGVSSDVSIVPVSLVGGVNTINTNGNVVTLSQSIGQGGAGSLVKAGTGTLNLLAGNTYTGGTSVTGGMLAVNNGSGSATGTGSVSFASSTTLTGAGIISGAVTTSTGTTVVPGNAGVGNLTLGALSLAPNSIADFEFASTSSYDRIVTTGSNGLTVNGGNLHLYAAGGTTPFSTPGTYNLMQFSGAVQGTGPGALSVLNPQAGYAYTFGTNGSFLTLLIELDAILSQWTATGAGSWASSPNWGNGVPASGYTAQLTTSLAADSTITLDGNRTINGLVLQSANAYTIAQGTSGTLTFDKGVKNAAVNVTLGQHTISAPVALASSMAVSADANTGLTISGPISGAGGVIKTGPGVLDLTGANSFTGAINVTGGVLGFRQATGLGTGSLTLNGGTLRYDTGNTADISSRTITFGQDGAIIDTNGNDVIWMNPVGNGGIGLLTKTGAGILALDAANTHSGGTTVALGTLRISADSALGVAGSQFTLNGGKLSVGGISLITDTTARPVAVGSTGGSIVVDNGATFTLPGVLSGSGVLTKEGAGTLHLVSPTAVSSGGTTISAGTVNIDLLAGSTPVSNTIVNVTSASALGSGTITFSGGSTLSTTVIDGNSLSVANAINVPAGQSGTFVLPNRVQLLGAISGAGTLNLPVKSTVTRTDIMSNFAVAVGSEFTGTLNLLNATAGGTGATIVRLMCNNTPAFNGAGLVGAKVNLATGVGLDVRTNSGGNTIQIGELQGGAGGVLTNEAGGAATFQIGALNGNSVYAGNITPGNNTANHITKVGTGSLTLTGTNTSTGNYTVNAGSLILTGASDTVTTVTVAVGATLGGNGSLGGAVTVNGNLQTDSTGTLGGKLTHNGIGAFVLGATAVTTFDFTGAAFTGVKSTSTGGFTYGGTMKLNFKGTVFNGSYQLFEIAGTKTGAFTGVSVIASAVETPLVDQGGGVWQVTVGSQTYAYNSGTGVLTVDGGATAVTPGASTLSATAGNAKVDLSWTAASGGNTYTVKRATVAGGPYTNVVSNQAGTSYSDTGLTNGTNYFYVVQAKNTASGLTGPSSNEVSATPVAAPTHTALQDWRFAAFGVYDDTGAVLAGDNEDFDGDGLVNLLEYALGTNPTVANASPVTVSRTGNNLVLTYPRRSPVDTALAYSVLGSADLTTGFVATTGATNTAGSTTTYTDNVDLSVAGVRRFLRLSVTYTAP